MPKIIPAGGEVDWDANEGTLGIVGVAPWATLDFCREFYACFKATKDWHYPRVLIDVNTKLPSRGRHLQLGEQDPSPYIRESILELAANGATLAVVACNTAHILEAAWNVDLPIPVISIIDATTETLKESGVNTVVCLTSASLAKSKTYSNSCLSCGIAPVEMSDNEQLAVSTLIEAVKTSSNDTENCMQDVLRIVEAKNVQGVVLGCTELSGLRSSLSSMGLKVIDSNRALASVAARRLRSGNAFR